MVAMTPWPSRITSYNVCYTKLLRNLIFEREVGAGAGHEVEFEYAWETRWRASPSFEYGFQAFGSFGELGDLSGLSKLV